MTSERASTFDEAVVGARAYGDRGVLLELGRPGDVASVAALLEREGLDVIAGWSSVLVVGGHAIGAIAERFAGRVLDGAGDTTASPVVVEVAYDGADLDEVARACGIGADEVIALHTGATYTVVLLGFGRGFPYLAGLPQLLHAVGRRASPRTWVPAGSVAIANGIAGIYPSSGPGGWALLGTTAAALFDPRTDPPSPLRTGTRVRFESAGPQP